MTDVFISYSRKDIAFARLLHQALVENELETWIDWQDIPPSADWLAEVYEAIEAADAFVFIISETSLASEICGLEIAHAAKHNKRLIPIVIHDVEAEQVPKELSVLNWIFFDDAGEKFAEAMDDLVTAITVDQAWVKYHTRFENRALDWDRKDRDRGLLLRGADLSEAESWLAGSAGKDPQPTALQTEFILKSREDATRRQRLTLIGVGVGLVVAVGLGILAWTQRNVAVAEGQARATAQAEAEEQRNVALEQEQVAVEQRDIAEEQRIVAEARQLAALSQAYLETDLDLAVLLSIEGHKRDPNYLTEGSLLGVLQEDPYTLRQFHFQLGITDLEFHPSDKYIAIASSYNIYFWDQVKNKQVFNPIINHTRPVTDIAINKDGSLLASASQDGTLKLWDLENDRMLIATLLENEITTDVKKIAFSPDDSILAALTSNEIWVWNTSSWEVISKNGGPLSVDTNNDGLNVTKNLVINEDNEIFLLKSDQLEVWDYESGERIAQLPADNIEYIEISPNAEQVVGINEDEPRISIWDSATYELVNDIRITSTTYDYTSTQIKFHPQRNLLFLINNKVLQYLNLENPDQLVTLKTLPVSTQLSPQNVLAFSKDGRSLIYGGKEGVVNLRSVYSTDSKNDPFYGYKSIGDGLTLSPDGTVLAATGLNDKEELIIHIWEYPDLIYTGSINLGQGDTRWDDSYKTLFLPDGNLVFSGLDEEIRFYDPDNLSRIDKQLDIGDEVRSIVLSPDGSLLAVLKGYSAGVDIWDVKSGELLGEIVLNEENRLSENHIDCIAISPDNKTLAAGLSGGLGSAANLITFWDLENMSLIGNPVIGPSGLKGVNDLEYSHDGTMLASSDDQGTTLLWDVQTRFSIGAPMSGNSRTVTRVLFSPDDSVLFAGTSAGEIILWDVQTQQQIGLPISGVSARQLAADLPNFDAFYGRNGHTDRITNVILDSDGRFLVTMDNGGRLGIWDFDIDSWHEKACFKAGRNLTQDEWGLYFPHEPYRATCPQFAENPDQAEIDFSDISTRIREIDDMVQVFIPSGEFEYGSSTWTDDGGIFRIIDLDAFWIDQTEVSNAQYQLCVAAGACTPPASNSSETRTGGYYGSETYAAYPVVFISFSQAEEYCRWVGGRLPLETEWEKAARGTSGYDYPWGNSPPEPDYVNFHYLNPDTVAVDSYPAGASPYGVLNMAGNVSEWAYDYPMEGESDLPLRIRGGAYDDTYVYTWMIESSFDGYYWNDIGFRCVDDE